MKTRIYATPAVKGLMVNITLSYLLSIKTVSITAVTATTTDTDITTNKMITPFTAIATSSPTSLQGRKADSHLYIYKSYLFWQTSIGIYPSLFFILISKSLITTAPD